MSFFKAIKGVGRLVKKVTGVPVLGTAIKAVPVVGGAVAAAEAVTDLFGAPSTTRLPTPPTLPASFSPSLSSQTAISRRYGRTPTTGRTGISRTWRGPGGEIGRASCRERV